MGQNKYKSSTLSSVNVDSLIRTAISKKLPEFRTLIKSIPFETLLTIDKLTDINIQIGNLTRVVSKHLNTEKKRNIEKVKARVSGNKEPISIEADYLNQINRNIIKFYELYKDTVELKKKSAINALSNKILITKKTEDELINKKKKYKFFDPKAYLDLWKDRATQAIKNYRFKIQSESMIKRGQYEDRLKKEGLSNAGMFNLERIKKDIAFALGKENTSLFSRLSSRLLKRFGKLEEKSVETSVKYKESVWTTKDSLALTQVIPTWLGKIYQALTGKAETFDYRTGAFRNAKDVLEQEKKLNEIELNDLKKKLIAVSKRGRSTREFNELKAEYLKKSKEHANGFYANSENNRSALENVGEGITGNSFSQKLKENLNRIKDDELISEEEVLDSINKYTSTFESILFGNDTLNGFNRLFRNATATRSTMSPNTMEDIVSGSRQDAMEKKFGLNEKGSLKNSIKSEEQARNIVDYMKRHLQGTGNYAKNEYNESKAKGKSANTTPLNNSLDYIRKIYEFLVDKSKIDYTQLIYERLIKDDKLAKNKYKTNIKVNKETKRKSTLEKRLDALRTSSEYSKAKADKKHKKKEEKVFNSMGTTLKQIKKNTKGVSFLKSMLLAIPGALASLGSSLIKNILSLPSLIIGGLVTAFAFLKPILKGIKKTISFISSKLFGFTKSVEKAATASKTVAKNVSSVAEEAASSAKNVAKSSSSIAEKAASSAKTVEKNSSNIVARTIKRVVPEAIKPVAATAGRVISKVALPAITAYESYKKSKTTEKDTGVKNQGTLAKTVASLIGGAGEVLNQTGQLAASLFSGGAWILSKIPGVPDSVYKNVSKTMHKAADNVNRKYFNTSSKGSLANILATAAAQSLSSNKDNVITAVMRNITEGKANRAKTAPNKISSNISDVANGKKPEVMKSVDKFIDKHKSNNAASENRGYISKAYSDIKYKLSHNRYIKNYKGGSLSNIIPNYKDKQESILNEKYHKKINKLDETKKSFINTTKERINKIYTKASGEAKDYMDKYNKYVAPTVKNAETEIVAKLDSKNLEAATHKSNELLDKMLNKLSEISDSTVANAKDLKNTVKTAVTHQMDTFSNTMTPMINTVTNAPNNVFNMFNSPNQQSSLGGGISQGALQHSTY